MLIDWCVHIAVIMSPLYRLRLVWEDPEERLRFAGIISSITTKLGKRHYELCYSRFMGISMPSHAGYITLEVKEKS